MPHDKNGDRLNVGDYVLIVDLTTAEPMPGTGNPTPLTLNAKQVFLSATPAPYDMVKVGTDYVRARKS